MSEWTNDFVQEKHRTITWSTDDSVYIGMCFTLLTTSICVSKLTINGSDISLSRGWHQAIIWANIGILLICPSGTNFSETLIEILKVSFKKMHLKVPSAKWGPFCLGLNVLSKCLCNGHPHAWKNSTALWMVAGSLWTEHCQAAKEAHLKGRSHQLRDRGGKLASFKIDFRLQDGRHWIIFHSAGLESSTLLIDIAHNNRSRSRFIWWRHQMESFSALLVFCAGNSPIPGEFPSQRPVTRNFDVFFDLCVS